MRKLTLLVIIGCCLALCQPGEADAECWECVSKECEQADDGHSGDTECYSVMTCISSCSLTCETRGDSCEGGCEPPDCAPNTDQKAEILNGTATDFAPFPAGVPLVPGSSQGCGPRT